jgi:hypothetical protein
MNNLLELALEAHGGLARWSQLETLTADLSVTGALWRIKGQAGALQQIRIEAELPRQKLTTHFRGQDAQPLRRISSLSRVKVEGSFSAVKILVPHLPAKS